MNKKFSTLVASMLLATTVGTVSAQNLEFTKSALPTNVRVESVADGKCYQLTDGWNVLVMQKVSTEKGDRFILKYVPYYAANIGESLWYVTVDKDNKENGVAFKFMNLAYNYPISFDPAKIQDYKPGKTYEGSYLAGEAVAWAWMRSEASEGLNVGKTPEAYFKTDSVMTLIPNADGTVAAVKYDVRETDKLAQLNIRPAVAGPVWLGKNDLNSMLQTQDATNGKTSFSFEKDVTEGLANLWSAGKGHAYEAVDAVGESTLSYGAVADAAAEKDAAMLAANEAEKKVEAAVKALADAESEYNVLAQKIQNVESEKVEKGRELVNQSWIYNFLNESEDATKQAILQKKQSIATSSALNEEAKKQLAELAEKLEAAQNEYKDAVAAQTALQNSINNATDAWNVALDVKNKAFDQKSRYAKWGTAMRKYFNETNNVYYVSDMGYAPNDKPQAWNSYFDAAKVTDEAEKEAFVEYGHRLYAILKEANNGVDISMSASAYKSQNNKAFINGVNALNTEENETFEKAAEAVIASKGAIASISKDLDVAIGVAEEKKQAEKAASTAYDEMFEAYGVHSQALEEAKKELKELEEELASVQAELKEVSAKKVELETAIFNYTQQIASLNEQLMALDGEKGAAYWTWVDARYAHKDAERAAIKASEVFENIRLEKSFNWLSLKAGKNAKGQDTYLMVDTAYLNGSAGEEIAGIQHLGFATREHEADFKSVNNLAARDINGRFNFRFFYWPTQDSLRIEADGYNVKNVTTKYWKDRTNSEIDIFATSAKGQENNLVKIAVLGGARREATIGSSEELKGTGIYTYNDRIGLSLSPAAHNAVLEPGIYFMDVVNGADAQKNGARLMVDLNGLNLTKVAPAEWDVMNFEHMPAAKWFVNQNTNEFGGYPEIWNQETGATLNNGSYKVLADGNIVINYYYNNEEACLTNDTLKLTKTVSNRLGFFNDDAKNVNYTLNYLNVGNDLGVTIGNSTVGNDTILRVSADEATKFELVKWGNGYNTPIFEKDTIFQTYYQIRVNDPYKFANNQKYVQVSEVGGTEMMVVTEGAENGSVFTLKEVNCVDGTHYYALLTEGKKAGVIDATGLIKAENVATESTTSAFALVADTTALYREFTADELGENGAMKFYRVNSTAKAYLYEGADNLLCVEGKGDDKAEAFNVIPTGVENTLMPQYLIAKDVNFVVGDTVLCDATTHSHATIEEALKCPHSKVTADTTFGRFLVNMIDSVPAVKKYTWEGKYKRLAFLPGYMTAGNLVLDGTTHKVALKLNAHDQAKFSFRLVNEGSNDFLIESESYGKKTAFDGGIAPSANLGGWVKVQNGVPVIINDFEAAMQSDLYNVDTNAGGATANDEITTSEVTIIAGEGNVTIANAAGKKVVVSNILGQVVATQVLTSDNAVIAAPQGVVVVAVEGEEAVKAIVR